MFLDFLFSMTMMIIQSYMNLMLWFMQIFLYEYIYSVQNIYFCIEAHNISMACVFECKCSAVLCRLVHNHSSLKLVGIMQRNSFEHCYMDSDSSCEGH